MSKRAHSGSSDKNGKATKASKVVVDVPSTETSPVGVTTKKVSCDDVPCPLSASEVGYMKGFGGQYSTEVLKGALPVRGNGPQHVSGPSCSFWRGGLGLLAVVFV
jgi:hypothetical protein